MIKTRVMHYHFTAFLYSRYLPALTFKHYNGCYNSPSDLLRFLEIEGRSERTSLTSQKWDSEKVLAFDPPPTNLHLPIPSSSSITPQPITTNNPNQPDQTCSSPASAYVWSTRVLGFEVRSGTLLPRHDRPLR
jgi:hypothetical protein